MNISKLTNYSLFFENSTIFLKISKLKFFLLKNSNIYFLLPHYIFIKKLNNSLLFIYSKVYKKKIIYFLFYFLNFLKKLNSLSRKKLFLTGLGLKITLINPNLLSFKLGFSHLVNLKVPVSVKVFVIKNNLYLESYNPALLGTFSNIIKKLKFPDSYKGKGFWFKSEKKKLKPVKKS
jgi:ribosomal protein L6P/L9E